MTQGTGSRILLVDDDVELANLIAEFLTKQGFLLTPRHTGQDGLTEALEGTYDLVILDVMLPGLDGFEVLRRLRCSSYVPVILLTARTQMADIIRGLHSGADDYLPKPVEPRELAARMRAILRRVAAHTGPRGLAVNNLRLEPASRRIFQCGTPVDVTSVEYDILETLLRSAGRVVSRDELAQKLYKRQATPFDRAIDVHISHLRKKLAGSHEMIRTVRGVGYFFTADQLTTDS